MHPKPLILIIDSNEPGDKPVKQLLPCHEFEVMVVTNPPSVLSGCQDCRPDLVIIGPYQDVEPEALELARQIRQCYRQLPIILITQQSSEAQAIAALRAGINDYFKLPFPRLELLASIRRNLSASPVRSLPNDIQEGSDLDESRPLLGQSPLMAALRTYLLKVAVTDSNVLITGETGAGKELVAQLLHKHSARHGRPLVCINCAALPDSLLESELFGYEKGAFTGAHAAYAGKLKLAEGGTVFLDEISDMSPCAQAKLLRAIESKEIYRLGGKQSIPVDFRVIAATNQELESLLPDQKFRKDLFFRLNVARIRVPPLRDRKEDIPLLLNHYLYVISRRFGRTVKGFSEEALACLLRYEWPGNVRELKNLVEALLINLTSSWISLNDLPEALRKFATDGSPSERERLLAALYATHWNKSKAAQQLNWSRMTLYRKMARYQIQNLSAATEPEGSTITPFPEL